MCTIVSLHHDVFEKRDSKSPNINLFYSFPAILAGHVANLI